MKELPEKFLARMKRLLGPEYEAFLASYSEPPKRGLRANTLKTTPKTLMARLPFGLTASKASPDGLIVAPGAEGLGKHPYHQAGAYYVQEPSAMAPADALGVRPGMRVLDLCAAPGGKSAAIAAALKGRGLLIANEPVRSRARTLMFNLERMGAVNAVVTNAMPDALAERFPGYFDAVLVDAPCSGEGMFRKDDGAIENWSEANVLASAARQAAILDSAVKMLRGGGKLVYSTCTFSREENEANAERLAAQYPWLRLERMERFYPHSSEGEGQFYAAFECEASDAPCKPQDGLRLKTENSDAFRAFMADTFIKPPSARAYAAGGRVKLIADAGALPAALENLAVLSAGVDAGEVRGTRFEPAHGLFMAAHDGEYARKLSFGPDDEALGTFLSGNVIPVDAALGGYVPVAVDGMNVGFGKAVGGTLKNHVPKGLRVT